MKGVAIANRCPSPLCTSAIMSSLTPERKPPQDTLLNPPLSVCIAHLLLFPQPLLSLFLVPHPFSAILMSHRHKCNRVLYSDPSKSSPRYHQFARSTSCTVYIHDRHVAADLRRNTWSDRQTDRQTGRCRSCIEKRL